MASERMKGGRLEPPHDLQGKHGAFSFSDLLRMLRLTRVTGTLTLTEGVNQRAVILEDGHVRYLTGIGGPLTVPISRSRRIRIKLTSEQTADLSQRGLKMDESIVNQLHASGMVVPHDQDLCPEEILRLWVSRLILWRDCSFSFSAGKTTRLGGIAIDREMERSFLACVRRIDAWTRMLPIVPSTNLVYRWRREQPDGPPPPEVRDLFMLVNGKRDVLTIACMTGRSLFEAARDHCRLVQDGFIEPMPIERQKLVLLFSFLLESIYLRLSMLGHSGLAYELERDLDRFAMKHGLRVRMAGGKTSDTDHHTNLSITGIIDLYRLFFLMKADKLAITLAPDLAERITKVLQPHHDSESRRILGVFAFDAIDHLLDDCMGA